MRFHQRACNSLKDADGRRPYDPCLTSWISPMHVSYMYNASSPHVRTRVICARALAKGQLTGRDERPSVPFFLAFSTAVFMASKFRVLYIHTHSRISTPIVTHKHSPTIVTPCTTPISHLTNKASRRSALSVSLPPSPSLCLSLPLS